MKSVSLLCRSIVIGLCVHCVAEWHPARAADVPASADRTAGIWLLDFHAAIYAPNPKDISGEKATALSSYGMFLTGEASFEVQNDGKVSFEVANGRFYHTAKWETADGTARAYQFASVGMLKGTGQFADGALKLKLGWKPGEGTGTSDGKAITQSVITDAVTSEWELKPVEPWAKAVPEWRRKAVTFSAQSSSRMPQKLAGCPPLPLVEHLSLVKAPTADLQVSVKAAPESGDFGDTCKLTVTVKNFGPDESPVATVRVSLPPGTRVLSPNGITKKPDLFHTLKFPIEELAKDATTTVNVEYDEAGEPAVESKSTQVLVMAHVIGTGFDPDQSNNGRIVKMTSKSPSAAPSERRQGQGPSGRRADKSETENTEGPPRPRKAEVIDLKKGAPGGSARNETVPPDEPSDTPRARRRKVEVIDLKRGAAAGDESRAASPRAEAEASPEIRGWGKFIDPAGDCEVAETDGRVSITIPAGWHDLNPIPEFDNMKGPRLLQTVAGDFRIHVKVPAFAHPAPNTSSTKQDISYVAAGLVVWQDDETFLRCLRAAKGEEEGAYVQVEAFQNAKRAQTRFHIRDLNERNIPDEAVFLRVERRGDELQVSRSLDGTSWNLFATQTIRKLPERLSVGVAAVNATTREFAPSFEKLEVNAEAGNR